mgnify:CR=1 FL=1
MTTYRVKNWAKFQHFKNRRPPWIKLYRDILERRDINVISDRCFRVLVGLWLLASESREQDGTLPPVEDIAFRLRLSKDDVLQAISQLSDFLDGDDIKAISKRYQDDPPETETEIETERERETEGDARGREDAPKPGTPKLSQTAAVRYEDLPAWLRTAPGMDAGTWAAWIDTRRRKRASVGGSAIALCLGKLQARPDKAVAYLQLAVERGWQGVSWDWFDAAAQGQSGAGNRYQRPDPEDVTPDVAASKARRRQAFEAYLSSVKASGRIPTKAELASMRAAHGAIPDDDWRGGCEWARNSDEFRKIVQEHA